VHAAVQILQFSCSTLTKICINCFRSSLYFSSTMCNHQSWQQM